MKPGLTRLYTHHIHDDGFELEACIWQQNIGPDGTVPSSRDTAASGTPNRCHLTDVYCVACNTVREAVSQVPRPSGSLVKLPYIQSPRYPPRPLGPQLQPCSYRKSRFMRIFLWFPFFVYSFSVSFSPQCVQSMHFFSQLVSIISLQRSHSTAFALLVSS